MNLAAGTDTVNTNSAATITGAGQLTTNGVAVSSVENLASSNGNLTTTGTADTINLTANQAGDTNGVNFTGIGALDAAAGSDTVNTNAVVGVNEAIQKQLVSNGVTVSNVEILGGPNTVINGSTSNEIINLTGATTGNVAGIGFTTIGTINVGNGSDRLNTSAATALTGMSGQVVSNGVTISNLEVLGTSNGTFNGSAGNDTVDLTATNTGSTGGVTFSDVNTMNLAAGTDTVNTNAAATLTGVSGQFVTNGVTLSNAEFVNSSNGVLNGTTGIDTFNITGDQSGNVGGLNFTGVNTINASDGNDILNFGATQAGGLDFNGQGGIDTANITASVTLTTDNIDAELLNVGANTVQLTGNNLVDSIAVNNTGGTLNINGAETVNIYTQSGISSLGGAATLTTTTATLNGGLVTGKLNGTTSITSTAAVGVSGNLSGGSLLVTGGTLIFSGTSTNNPVIISGGATLIDTGNLSNTAAVTNAGTLTVNGVDTIGTLTNNAGTVNGTSTLTVAGATLFNGGLLGSPLTVTGNGGGTFTGATIAGTFNGVTLLDGSTVTGTGTVNGNTTTANAVAISGSVGGGSLTVVSGLLKLTGISTNNTVSIFKDATLNSLNPAGSFDSASSVTNNGTLVLNGPDMVKNLTSNGNIRIDSLVSGGGDLGFVASGKIILGPNSTLLLDSSTLGIGQIYDVFDGAITGSFAANGITATGGPKFRYSFNSVTGSIQALPDVVPSVKSSNTIFNLNANQTETIGSLFEDSYTSLPGGTNFGKVFFDGPGGPENEPNIVPGPTQFFVLDLDPGTGTSADPALAQLVTAITQVQTTYSFDDDGNIVVGAAGINILNRLSPEVHRGMVDYTEQASRAHIRDGVEAAPIAQMGETQVVATASGTFAGAESNGTNADYNTQMMGLTTGVRHNVDPRLQVGALLGANDGNIDGAFIDTDAQGIVFGVFGRYLADEASKTLLTGSLSYGVYEYDAARRTFGGTATANGIGSDALEFAIGVSTVAYEEDKFRIRPSAGIRYLSGSVDGFMERGGGVNLDVESQDLDSLLVELGANFEYDVQENFSIFGHLGYVTDFEDSDHTVSARFAASGASGRQFGVNAPGIDDQAFVVGLGGYYDVTPNARVGFNYRGEFRSSSQTTHTVGIGASYGF